MAPPTHSWAFSIWGIIFLLQGAGAVYQAIGINYGSKSHEKELAVLAAGWIQGVWLLQCLWQVGFSKERFGVCLGLICAASLFAMYTGLQLQEARVNAGGLSTLSTWTLSVPTSINGAWLIAATSVQFSIAFKSFGMTEAHLEVLGGALLSAASVGALYMLCKYGDLAWGAASVRALTAIATNGAPKGIFFVAVIGAGLVLLSTLLTAAKNAGCCKGECSLCKAICAKLSCKKGECGAPQTQFVTSA
jgi:hypothetical protein